MNCRLECVLVLCLVAYAEACNRGPIPQRKFLIKHGGLVAEASTDSAGHIQVKMAERTGSNPTQEWYLDTSYEEDGPYRTPCNRGNFIRNSQYEFTELDAKAVLSALGPSAVYVQHYMSAGATCDKRWTYNSNDARIKNLAQDWVMKVRDTYPHVGKMLQLAPNDPHKCLEQCFYMEWL